MSLKATLKHPSGRGGGPQIVNYSSFLSKNEVFKDNWICLSIFVYLLDNATGKCSII